MTRLTRLIADIGSYDRVNIDIITSAAIIHDMWRYGLDDKGDVTTLDHPLNPRIMAMVNSITCIYADSIFDIAEKHMGKWGPDKRIVYIAPEDALHIADAISAHANDVWEQLGDITTSWIGGVPFSEQGMTQDAMTLMEELAGNNEYWKTSLSFVRSTSSLRFSNLTEKQQAWIFNIVDSLNVELNKRAAKEAFNDS